MDKDIAPGIISKRKNKRILIAVLVIIILVSMVWLLRTYVRSSIDRSDIITAKVEEGAVQNTINASGEVLPEFEEILTSPINASIKSALIDAGNSVKTGQSVLTLDKSAAQTEYEKQKFQLESKMNEISKLKLNLDKSFYDIKSNNDIKQLRIASLTDAVESAKKLYNAGGGTREGIEQAQLNLKVAQLEKSQLENEIKSKQLTMQLEIKEAKIAAEIQKNDLKELQRKLDLANIVATRNGVITYVNKNIGATVREGETLVRIADLSGFKVAGSIADNAMDQLRSGVPVIIRINEVQLRGQVTNISPSIHNGIVSFDIRLDERNHKMLRPNMKVDVFLVTAEKSHAVRVANGPTFKGPSVQDIFIVRDGKAIRKTVHIGLSNFDYVEIKDGVKAGDVVIISDMSAYKNSSELKINN
jgi:HlyD family secretion protein